MKIANLLVAVSVGLSLAAASASAAVVDFQLKVDGSSDPVNVELGETVEVQLWAKVTDNTHNGTPLGLMAYLVDIHSSSSNVLAVPRPGSPGQWNLTYHTPSDWMGTSLAMMGLDGSVLSLDLLKIEQHGDGTSPVNPPVEPGFAAEQYTLLASGWFEAAALGQSQLSLNMPPAYIAWVGTLDSSQNYRTEADTVHLGDALLVNVVPEPAGAALLLGLVPLLRRRRTADVRA